MFYIKGSRASKERRYNEEAVSTIMAKLAIFLCLLVAVACVPSTQAGFFDSWGERVHQAQEKVAKLVNNAIENFKKQVEAIKKHALDLATDVKKQGEDIIEGINSKISDLLKNVDDRIAKLTGDAGDVDVTQCTDMAKEIKTTALTIMANSSYCVVDKIDQASGYIEGINAASQGAVNELVKITQKASDCTENINGIESSMKAFTCIGLAMKDATVAVTRKIPDVVINITKMAYLVGTLIPSLSLCSATSSISVLIDEINAVMSSVEGCINETLGAHLHTTVTDVAGSIETTLSTVASSIANTVENLETLATTTVGAVEP